MAIAASTAEVMPLESSKPAVSWGAIIAGAFAASITTVILTLLGSGLGLTMVSPWSGEGAGLTTVAASALIWLIIVQWLSSGAGRLRTKWVGIHTDEVFFRDTAHGFLAWALASMLVVGVLGSAVSSIVSGGVQAAASVASGVTSAAGSTAQMAAGAIDQEDTYFIDTLFRPSDPARLADADGQAASTSAAAEAARILANSASAGELSAEDRTYLSQLVAARTGLSQADAEARVDQVVQRIQAAKVEAQEAADAARKASATFALVSALSLIVGAFIASAAAAFGGRQRDEEEDVYLVGR